MEVKWHQELALFTVEAEGKKRRKQLIKHWEFMVWKLSLWFVSMQRIRWRESISLSGTKWFGSDINDQINYPLLLSNKMMTHGSVTIFYKSRNAYQIVVENYSFPSVTFNACELIIAFCLGGQSSINGCSWFFSQMSNKSPIQNIDYSRFLLSRSKVGLFDGSFGIMKASKESKNTLSFKGIAEWTSIKGWDKPKRGEAEKYKMTKGAKN